MSIQSEIDRIKMNISAAYTAIEGKLQSPLDSNFVKNSDNLVQAINDIPSSSLKIVRSSYSGTGVQDTDTSRTITFSNSSISNLYLVVCSGKTLCQSSYGAIPDGFGTFIWVYNTKGVTAFGNSSTALAPTYKSSTSNSLTVTSSGSKYGTVYYYAFNTKGESYYYILLGT